MTPEIFTAKCAARWRRDLPPHAASILHAALGLVLEMEELNASEEVTNTKAEVGDILFFYSMLRHDSGMLPPVIMSECDPNWMLRVYDVAEAAKRYAVYWTPEKAAPLQAALQEALNKLWASLVYVWGYENLISAMEANDRKLTARFGGAGFSAEKAVDRSHENEMKAIEEKSSVYGIMPTPPGNVIPILYRKKVKQPQLSTYDRVTKELADLAISKRPFYYQIVVSDFTVMESACLVNFIAHLADRYGLYMQRTSAINPATGKFHDVLNVWRKTDGLPLARPNPGSGDGSDDLADHNAAQADEGD